MPKKSEALIAAEARVQELEKELIAVGEKNEEDMLLVLKQEKQHVDQVQQRFYQQLKQTEFLLEIIRDKAPVSQFIKDEAGRLIAESSKLRP